MFYQLKRDGKLWSLNRGFRDLDFKVSGLQGFLFAMAVLGLPSACEELLNSAKQHGHVISTCGIAFKDNPLQSGLGLSLGFRA